MFNILQIWSGNLLVYLLQICLGNLLVYLLQICTGNLLVCLLQISSSNLLVQYVCALQSSLGILLLYLSLRPLWRSKYCKCLVNCIARLPKREGYYAQHLSLLLFGGYTAEPCEMRSQFLARGCHLELKAHHLLYLSTLCTVLETIV